MCLTVSIQFSYHYIFDIFIKLHVYIKDHSGKTCQNIDLHKALINLNIFQVSINM